MGGGGEEDFCCGFAHITHGDSTIRLGRVQTAHDPVLMTKGWPHVHEVVHEERAAEDGVRECRGFDCSFDLQEPFAKEGVGQVGQMHGDDDNEADTTIFALLDGINHHLGPFLATRCDNHGTLDCFQCLC